MKQKMQLDLNKKEIIMPTLEDLDRLQLHETIHIDGDNGTYVSVRKVPGGFIYTTTELNNNIETAPVIVTTTFVPYSRI